ncbi:response regulator transcription factor [Nocardioides rubriscoriae]|uniref:response regulator transcription factor n=1 Tax=Nocardioides rubriscoriae TaxID=642762 RepID=UPI001FE887DF|nr:response regulator transcription factor [Nocardioides rubriscoriae]
MSSAPRDGTRPPRPLRIAIANDYEIVVAGIAAVLEPYADRVEVVELVAGLSPISDVDVLLYDTFAQRQGESVPVADLVGDPARLVVFSWNGDAALVAASLAAGASGYVSKGATAGELVDALERVHAGEQVVPVDMAVAHGDVVPADPDHGIDQEQELGRWPGDEHGLSARESEVLALICRGLSNDEITRQAFIGINTVKTHIRTLYRKIGVERRTQAVLWGQAHGFAPDRVRDLT